MRKFRNATLASVAAVSIMLGGVSVASAESSSLGSGDKSTKIDCTKENANQRDPKDIEGKIKTPGELHCVYPADDVDGSGLDSGNRNDKYDPAVEKKDKDAYAEEKDDAARKHQDPNIDTNSFSSDVEKTFKRGDSSAFGDRYNADTPVSGADLSGMNQNFSKQPIWSQIWKAGMLVSLIGSFVGLTILPVLNQMRHDGIIL